MAEEKIEFITYPSVGTRKLRVGAHKYAIEQGMWRDGSHRRTRYRLNVASGHTHGAYVETLLKLLGAQDGCTYKVVHEELSPHTGLYRSIIFERRRDG